jgi:hypothetical protein
MGTEILSFISTARTRMARAIKIISAALALCSSILRNNPSKSRLSIEAALFFGEGDVRRAIMTGLLHLASSAQETSAPGATE